MCSTSICRFDYLQCAIHCERAVQRKCNMPITFKSEDPPSQGSCMWGFLKPTKQCPDNGKCCRCWIWKYFPNMHAPAAIIHNAHTIGFLTVPLSNTCYISSGSHIENLYPTLRQIKKSLENMLFIMNLVPTREPLAIYAQKRSIHDGFYQQQKKNNLTV